MRKICSELLVLEYVDKRGYERGDGKLAGWVPEYLRADTEREKRGNHLKSENLVAIDCRDSRRRFCDRVLSDNVRTRNIVAAKMEDVIFFRDGGRRFSHRKSYC